EAALELLVAPAGNPSRSRITDDRLGMALRADDEVEIPVAPALEVAGHARRVEIEIGVDERDPAPVCGEAAELDRIPLAEIPVVVDDTHGDVTSGGQQPFGRAVDRPVRDHDQLELVRRESAGSRAADDADVLDDCGPTVVHRNDDAQNRARGRLRAGSTRGRSR